MPQGHRETIAAAQQVMQAYRETGEVSKELMSEFKEHRRTLYDYNQAINTIRTAHRTAHPALTETIRLTRQIASVGRTAMWMWESHNIAQIRLTQSKEAHAKASERVSELERIYIRYCRELGRESVFALDVKEKLNEARREEHRSAEKIQQAMRENVLGYASMGVAGLEFVAKVPTIVTQMGLVKSVLVGIDTAAVAANLSWLGMAATLALPITIGALIITGLTQPIEEMERQIEEVRESYKTLFTDIQTMVSDLPKSSGLRDTIEDLQGITGDIEESVSGVVEGVEQFPDYTDVMEMMVGQVPIPDGAYPETERIREERYFERREGTYIENAEINIDQDIDARGAEDPKELATKTWEALERKLGGGYRR